jgi:hypothetical protein
MTKDPEVKSRVSSVRSSSVRSMRPLPGGSAASEIVGAPAAPPAAPAAPPGAASGSDGLVVGGVAWQQRLLGRSWMSQVARVAPSRRLRLVLLLKALVLAFVHLPATGVASADFRVADLEREVRELRQQLRVQGQRIEALERQIARASGTTPLEGPVEPITNDGLPEWLDQAAWERIEPGSVREQRSKRVLYYALELCGNAFLAGHIELIDGRVSALQIPRLR